MSKKQFLKVTGFIGTLAAGTALVASAATGTGAYFSDSVAGTVQANTGHLTITAPDNNTTLNFQNVVPGIYKSMDVRYQVTGDTNSDVWLIFDPESDGYLQLTAEKGNIKVPDGGMGRYGHVKVSNDGNQRFTSFNLQNATPGRTDICPVDENGNGGSADVARDKTDYTTAMLCGVPAAIKLANDLTPGTVGTLNLEFGVTGLWTGQGVGLPNVPFKIVAIQHGVRPDAVDLKY